MASAEHSEEELFDEFLADRGHESDTVDWDESYNKLQCPDCGGLHDRTATECSVCGWQPD